VPQFPAAKTALLSGGSDDAFHILTNPLMRELFPLSLEGDS